MALLSFRGISTPSLPAQGGQRRFSYFNIQRGNPWFSKPDAVVLIRDNFAFNHPSTDDMDAAFQRAIVSQDDEAENWCIYMTPALSNAFFFVSDFVLVHGMSNALEEPDVNEAHRKLLGQLAPLANDLSEFTFGFAAAIFRKHFGGELTATIVAKIADAPNIDDLRLPFFVETPTLRNS
jgi:hypothetical protein